MVITITDNRSLIDYADATTGWSSPVAGESITLTTTNPDPKELSGHLAISVSESEGEVLHTHSSTNLSAGVLVYVWAQVVGSVDSQASYGMSMVLGDGTNTNAYQVAGSDVAVFRHNTGQVNYLCMVLDSGSLPTGKALQGTFGNFDDTQVTEFGANYNVSSKALGGADNCFVDTIKYGNGGLTIIGTDTSSYFLADLAALDAGDTSTEAYGICRDLGGGIYGVQSQILLGDTGTGGDTLRMIDQTFKIENFSGVGTDKFGITIQGNSTGTQTITFTNSTLFCPTGTGAFLTATDTNVESFDMTNCVILNFDQSIAFSTDATNGPNHDISDNKFVGCAQIDPGKTAFQDNIIDSTTDADGGMLIDSAVSLTNISGLSFVSDSTGHAIYITATGSYTFTNFTYTGYGAGETTDAAVYNNSGGAVTITVTGGDSPSVRNGASATTSVISGVTLTLTVKDSGGTAIVGARVLLEADTGGSDPYLDSVTIVQSGGTATVTHTSHGLATGEMVNIRDANEYEYNGGGKVITYATVNTYTYSVDSGASSPATGTITATQCYMSEVTVSGGIATQSYNAGGTQPARGYVAKADGSPVYYANVPLSISDISGGINLPVQMASDEG